MDDFEIPEDIVVAEVVTDVDQGTAEWIALRSGKITGSSISDVIAGGKGLVKDKYRTRLAIERLTGQPTPEGFKSKAMIKGNEDESLAREHYEFINDVDIKQVGFIHHPTLKNTGASPDGLVGDDGLIEIKCPDVHTHIEYITSKKIPRGYLLQMQWEMACTGRKWCDFITYRHELPVNIRSMIIRVNRDNAKIAELEKAVKEFDQEIDQLVTKLGQM